MYELWGRIALRAIGDTFLENRTDANESHVLDAVHAAMEREPEHVREVVPADVRDRVILRLAVCWLEWALAAEAHNASVKSVVPDWKSKLRN